MSDRPPKKEGGSTKYPQVFQWSQRERPAARSSARSLWGRGRPGLPAVTRSDALAVQSRDMNLPSRLMPKVHRHGRSPVAWVILGAFVLLVLVCLGYFWFVHPVFTTAVVAILALATSVSAYNHKRKLATLAETRSGESICEFARGFERRSVDTWVVRAVYEQVQELLRPSYANFPVRADDHLKDDLGIEMDDVEMDLAPVVAERTGRSLDHTESNPFFGRLTTAADLVHFFSAQPLVASRERST